VDMSVVCIRVVVCFELRMVSCGTLQ